MVDLPSAGASAGVLRLRIALHPVGNMSAAAARLWRGVRDIWLNI